MQAKWGAALTIAIGLVSLVGWWLVSPSTPARFEHDAELHALHHRWRDAALSFAQRNHHPPEEGNIVLEQVWAYLDVVRVRRPKVICETGFWMGMSAHLWLFSHNDSVLHSFDIHFPRMVVTALHSTFGKSRLRTYLGSTRKTLPKFRPPSQCDVVSIDASHEGWEPYNDLVEMLPAVRCNATVFFDDTFDDRAEGKPLDNDPSSATFYNACTRSYWRAVKEGLIAHQTCDHLGRRWRWGKWPKGYCVGRVVAHPPMGSCVHAALGR